jgi:hypothetical protein
MAGFQLSINGRFWVSTEGIVPIRRSQNAFACGHRTGVFNTVRPIAVTASSTAAAYTPSRS